MAPNNIVIGPWDNVPEIKQGGGSGNSGGGGGGEGGMEPRIAALETHVDYLRRDVSEIKAANEAIRSDVTAARVQLAQLVERIAHLPSKGFIVRVVMVALGVFAALIAFQQQIQKLLGISH